MRGIWRAVVAGWAGRCGRYLVGEVSTVIGAWAGFWKGGKTYRRRGLSRS